MSAKPRVAVLGAGYWGKNLIRNFDALGTLEAICDCDEVKRRPIYVVKRVVGFHENQPEAPNDDRT